MSTIFIVPTILVGLDDVPILMDAILILDVPAMDAPTLDRAVSDMAVLGVIFATLVAPVRFEFGLVLGVIFVAPAALVGFGFEFGLVLGALLVAIGITISASSYIR